jgi:hypothetical protein
VADENYERVVMAISELFLDVEHDELAFRHFARVLCSSGYSLEQLDGIYRDVAASLYINTYAPVGVWSGFDRAWVMGKVEFYRRKPHGGFLARLMSHLVTRSTIVDWWRLRSLVETNVSKPEKNI